MAVRIKEQKTDKVSTKCDIASSDWLKLAALCFVCFARKVHVKTNKPICDCARARPQSDRLI